MRFLLIMLNKAERAWAYAMDLRSTEKQGREVHLMMRKLRKAVTYGSMFEKLCAETADDRTALEAEAYSAWLAGSEHLEREQWESALDKFTRCRTVYDELSKVSEADEAKVFLRRIDEIDPSIRYCQYNLAKLAGDAGGRESNNILLQMQQSSASGATSDILKAKLDRVLAEQKKEAGGMDVTWLGLSVPVLSVACHQMISTAQRRHDELAGAEGTEGKLELFDKMLMQLEDAKGIIRDDISENLKKGVTKDEDKMASLQLLRNFVQGTCLMWTRERDLVLVETLQERLRARETGRKAVKPEDVVKLFEVLLQCTEDYGAIEGVGSDEGRSKAVAARTLMFKAWRVLYIGEAYVVLGKMAEAAALCGRARELEKVARLRFGESGCSDELDSRWLDTLKALSGRRLLQIRALAAEASAGAPQAGGEGARKVDSALRTLAATPLVQRLGSYEAAMFGEEGKMPKLVDFPPPIDAVACKPVLFDLALNFIKYPSLEERTKKKGGGGVLGWFRR